MLVVTARVFQQKKDSTEADKAQRPAAGWFYVLGRMLRSGVLDQDPYLEAEGIYKGFWVPLTPFTSLLHHGTDAAHLAPRAPIPREYAAAQCLRRACNKSDADYYYYHYPKHSFSSLASLFLSRPMAACSNSYCNSCRLCLCAKYAYLKVALVLEKVSADFPYHIKDCQLEPVSLRSRKIEGLVLNPLQGKKKNTQIYPQERKGSKGENKLSD
ncbi:hypothetical protein Anapl_15347 [Anas platyrhynchos]|uniref:Uncharacterized protein n=1 Tax=Anas platyrhynchos TaxID=8839 RepID=R0LRL1_ANAPL|nr:hypothetical protein Anapl_15347 [Anas platyrhynchos]